MHCNFTRVVVAEALSLARNVSACVVSDMLCAMPLSYTRLIQDVAAPTALEIRNAKIIDNWRGLTIPFPFLLFDLSTRRCAWNSWTTRPVPSSAMSRAPCARATSSASSSGSVRRAVSDRRLQELATQQCSPHLAMGTQLALEFGRGSL